MSGPRDIPSLSLYPHHRECIECGYDIFQLNTHGVCPECGKPVATTAALPHWQLQMPWRLDISRAGLVVAAAVAVATQFAALIAYLGMRWVPGDLPLFFLLPALIVAIFYSVALFALAVGVGGSAWSRWLPFCLFLASAGGAAIVVQLPADYSRNAWLNAALVFTAIWWIGRAHAAQIENIGAGSGRRAIYLRARRFARITRYTLLVPAAFMWASTAAVTFAAAQNVVFDVLGPIKLCSAVVLVWVLIATVYWLMIAQDCQHRTAGPPIA